MEWFSDKYLVYELGSCEMGSEGHANYYYYAVCEGNTEEEIMECYKRQVQLLYGIDSCNPKKIVGSDGAERWVNYYDLAYNRLPNDAWKQAKKLKVEQG